MHQGVYVNSFLYLRNLLQTSTKATLLKAETKQHRAKLNGLVSILNELPAQYLGSDGKQYMNSSTPLEYAMELYLGYETD